METHKHAFNSGIIRKSEYFDLFISYKRDNGGDNGEKLAIELYEKLTKDGFKVWLDNEEIGFSSNFEQRLEEAILHSKKVACIIGPEWVESPHCLFEVRKAIEFEKRIIPIHYQEFRTLLAAKKDSGVLTEIEWIRIDRPQEIDFSSKIKQTSSYEDLKSVCRLHDQITLEHNRILSESYYWSKYKQPKSMLLHGTGLSKTKLLMSKCNSDEELPSFSQLQHRFIEASENFVKTEVTDKRKVFLIFHQDDIEYTSELDIELKLNGVSTQFEKTFDHSVYEENEFQTMVMNSETILFISTHKTVRKQKLSLDFVRSNNKPVYQIVDSVDTKVVAEGQGEKNIHVWNNQIGIEGLVTLINGDKFYNTFHANLLGQSYNWESKEKNNSNLLSLKEAQLSREWYKKAEKENKDPLPSLSMINYVERSLAFAENQRKRKAMGLWTSVIGLFLFILLGFFYYQANEQVKIKKNDAKKAMDAADSSKKLAKQMTLEAKQMEENAKNAEASVATFRDLAMSAQKDARNAAVLASKSIKQSRSANLRVKIAEEEIFNAELNVKKAQKNASDALFEAQEANEMSKQAKYDLAITELKINAAKAALRSLEYSMDGQYASAKKWGLHSVSLYNEFKGEWETDVLYNAFINILNNSDTSIIDNLLAKEFKVLHNEEVNKSNTCSYIVDEEFNWELASEIYSEKEMVYAMAVSTSNKNIIALGLKTGDVLIYNRKTKKIRDTIKVGPYRITSLALRSDGKQLAVSSVDKKVFLFTLDNYINDELANNTIKIESSRRIEEIYYSSQDVVHAVYAPLVTNGVLEKEYRMFPATVKKLYDIINSK